MAAKPGQDFHQPKTWDELLHAKLAASPEFAVGYLNAAVAENHPPALLIALRHVVEARGGLAELAKHTNLNRARLARALRGNGGLSLGALQSVADALGLRLVFAGKDEKKKPVRRTARKPLRRVDAAAR